MKPRLVVLCGTVLLPVASAFSQARPAPSRVATSTLVDSLLVRKERELWDANRRHDARALDDLLAEDTYAVESDGRVANKRQQIASIDDLSIADVRMAGVHVLMASSTVGIIRYRLLLAGTFKGAAMKPAWSEVSAVWSLRAGRWQCVAYHETRIKA